MNSSAHARFALLLLLASTLMPPPVTAGGGPRLICDEPEYNFGEICNTEDVDHVFILRNAGDETLNISRVQHACGCMVARVADKRIPPGGQTELRARFILRGRRGQQRQTIRVESNDPVRPRFALIMAGEAIPTVSVRPDRIFWGNIHEDAVAEHTVELRFQLETAVSILDADTESPMFAVEQLVHQEGESYEIRVKTVPPMPSGPFEFPLRIRTDHRAAADISVPMSGRVVGDIFAVPSEIVLDPMLKEPATHFIIVRSMENKPFRVLEVEPPASGIGSDIRSTGSARAIVYLNNVRADADLDGTSVRIVTDSEMMPEISVPIRMGKFRDAGGL